MFHFDILLKNRQPRHFIKEVCKVRFFRVHTAVHHLKVQICSFCLFVNAGNLWSECDSTFLKKHLIKFFGMEINSHFLSSQGRSCVDLLKFIFIVSGCQQGITKKACERGLRQLSSRFSFKDFHFCCRFNWIGSSAWRNTCYGRFSNFIFSFFFRFFSYFLNFFFNFRDRIFSNWFLNLSFSNRGFRLTSLWLWLGFRLSSNSDSLNNFLFFWFWFWFWLRSSNYRLCSWCWSFFCSDWFWFLINCGSYERL
mmetsp:Transcript_10868/g.14136  ORF Transcript_10868/g.14136 Transcript_10868/m.14136 type:complete len:252 (+) Transcript_10868:1241-1996(+)